MQWFCRRRRMDGLQRTPVEHAVLCSHTAEDYIPAAAAALDLDPKVLKVLTKPSEVRQIPVHLGLLGNEPIYVDSQKQARKLERSDRAYAYITAAAS